MKITIPGIFKTGNEIQMTKYQFNDVDKLLKTIDELEDMLGCLHDTNEELIAENSILLERITILEKRGAV